jgi:endonuclease/exonuclease/phosphatase family metal-dependent hydrolase
LPIIVTGDFNTTASDERYRRFTGADMQPPLLANAYTLAHSPQVDPALHPDKRIDHILAGGPCHMEAEQWLIDPRPLKNGLPMSDHDPVLARLRFFDKPNSVQMP